jgi:REP element-mobilizing transposase RayT
MARMARVVVPGRWLQLTQRRNRRQIVFADDADRAMYIELLSQHCRQASVGIAGYCLVGDHVHLTAIPKLECGQGNKLPW